MTPPLRLPSLFQWLQANHPSQRAHLLHDSYEPAQGRSWSVQTIVLARSRCRLKWFRLNAIPPAERLAALRMQAQAWQPFDSNGYALSLHGESGLVMAWDRMRTEQDLAVRGADPSRCRPIPEPLLRQPGADGARLIRGLDGVEAQVWREGWLQASRWWPAAPSEQEWRLFLHASAATDVVGSGLPAIEEPAWLDRPWAVLRGMEGDTGQSAGLERRLAMGGALIAVAAAAAIGHQAWDVNRAIAQREQEIQGLRESSVAVLAARDQALARAAQAQQLSSWMTEPLPVEVLMHLHDTLKLSGVQLKEMELNGSKLRIGLQLSPQATRSAIVRDLQAGNWFKNVSEAVGSGATGMLVLEMTLEGLRPAPRAAGSAASAAPGGPGPAEFPPPNVFNQGGKP